MRRIADRFAARFGYVPAARLAECDAEWMKLLRRESEQRYEDSRRWKERWDRLMELYNTKAESAPRTRTGPEVVITTDYKQAPCS